MILVLYKFELIVLMCNLFATDLRTFMDYSILFPLS